MKQTISKRRPQISSNNNLIYMIKVSLSVIDDDVQEWINILPTMSVEQKNRLHEILLHEKIKLERIERKYEGEHKE